MSNAKLSASSFILFFFLMCQKRIWPAVIVARRRHSFLISISQEATADRFFQKSARQEVNACLEHLIVLNNLGGSSCSNEIAAVPAAEAPPKWEKFVSCACSSIYNRKEVLDKKGRYADLRSQFSHPHMHPFPPAFPSSSLLSPILKGFITTTEGPQFSF